jgi:hypothetical protein
MLCRPYGAGGYHWGRATGSADWERRLSSRLAPSMRRSRHSFFWRSKAAIAAPPASRLESQRSLCAALHGVYRLGVWRMGARYRASHCDRGSPDPQWECRYPTDLAGNTISPEGAGRQRGIRPAHPNRHTPNRYTHGVLRRRSRRTIWAGTCADGAKDKKVTDTNPLKPKKLRSCSL